MVKLQFVELVSRVRFPLATPKKMKKYSQKTVAEVEKLVRPIYSKLIVWAHGWEHIKKVAQAAKDLAEMENVDPVLCQIAAYCHDLGRLEEEERGIVNPVAGTPSQHAEFSVQPTEEILKSVGIDGRAAEEIIEAVRIHNIKKYEGENNVALILQDADRADGFGKMAILRFASFNCQLPIHEPKSDLDANGEFERLKEILKQKKDCRDRMLHTLEYVFGWVDNLANTESLKKYVADGYEFNKKFFDEIENY